MGKEIERKFLVTDNSYSELADSFSNMRQAYLSTNVDATVRVRIVDDAAFITVKGRNKGAVRDEWEYPIPVEDASDMIERCCSGRVIDKTRYRVGRWEIDEFHGSLQGLVLAEIELQSEDETFIKPTFIGEEVTGNPRYYNSNLAKG